MENNLKKKCSAKKHNDIDAITYCQECNTYLCNKCHNLHSELFESHHLFNIDKNINDIFTGFCKEKNHNKELKYFCKNHNKLCCGLCLCKIDDEDNGYHHKCDVCLIKDIEHEKRNNFKINIKMLEDISKNLEHSINQLKSFSVKINEEKENLKLEIQKIFTKIRNEINNREDKLLLEIENYFENKFFDENLIKKAEKLPSKIKYSLEKGKTIEKEWEKAKLNSIINDIINIENEIKDINLINDGIKKSKENEIINIKFDVGDESIQNILKMIKELGNIDKLDKYIFKEGKNYTINNNGSIATKTGEDGWNCTILFNNEIPKNKISKWKIKLNNFYIKSNAWNILIGIGPKYIENKEYFHYFCWSFICGSSQLAIKSGNQSNYNIHSGRLKKGDIIEVIVDRQKGDLSFAINDVNYGSTNIEVPKNAKLYPYVMIHDKGQIVEIVN